MCGIAGLLTRSRVDPDLLRAMAGALHHRGPDDGGAWSDDGAGIGLAHRRLAIVDLSPAGHQPMASASGRFVLSYNGEIYNHRAIRDELAQAGAVPEGGWRGHSDTETLLAAVDQWGLDGAIERATGMFALALWDRAERTLSLARDRFGEKPLYYGWAGSDFVFGSELKALRRHPHFRGEIDRDALAQLAARTYVPAPLSIYRRVFKLEPGTILALDLAAASQPREQPFAEGEGVRRYWSAVETARAGARDPVVDREEAVALVEERLSAAIRGQSVADVPVGAFLSGGIDSSTVVALYQALSDRPIRTYSIGFEEAGFDESADARRVAAHLGTVHHERIVTVAEAREVIPLLPALYDEPFGDSSQIPTFLVSRFARAEVTVALTGDGGDEMFGGYNRHVMAPRLWRQARRIPRPLRRVGGSALGAVPADWWKAGAALLPGRRGAALPAKIRKGLALVGSARGLDDIYGGFLDEWSGERNPVLGAASDPGFPSMAGLDQLSRLTVLDSITYLPDDILCKVDRASMAVSLETRVPFLDHHLAAAAARVAPHLKVADGRGKQVLRRLLEKHVPRALWDRPKAGFGVPVGQWIRGPLRDWAEALLDERRLRAEGWFDPAIVRRRFADHLAGRQDSSSALWSLLMFQAWLDEESARLSVAA